MKYKNLNEVQYLDFEEDIYSDSVPGSNLIFLLFLIFEVLLLPVIIPALCFWLLYRFIKD